MIFSKITLSPKVAIKSEKESEYLNRVNVLFSSCGNIEIDHKIFDAQCYIQNERVWCSLVTQSPATA